MPVETAPHPFLEGFEALLAARPAEPDRLAGLRAKARERFLELGFPSMKQEEWRFTNVAPLARREFRPLAEAGAVADATVERLSYPDLHRVVFVDGRHAPEHGRLEGLPDGVVAGSLRSALEEPSEEVLEHLGRHASFEDHAFVALNTALFEDGFYLYVPRGVVVERPIQLLYLASEDAAQGAIYPRNLIVAGEASQATLIETYRGETEEYFTCGVTEIVGEQGSNFDHYRLQRERNGAYHVATFQVWLDRDAAFSSHNISLGARFVRHDVNAILDGEGVDCTLDGLYVATDRQFVDNHMRVEHAKPHGSSHELYKGILDGRARAVFNGRIYVHEDAQKTDAKQTNRNLLLSRDALVNSNPQLEIFADDVKCTHGSTVGQLDEEAIFYLRSRGIEEKAARSLLTYAFASEVAEGIRVDAVRQELEEFLFARLAAGDIVRQAV